MEEYLTTNKWKPQGLIECFPCIIESLPSMLQEREEVYQEERDRIKTFIRYIQKEAPQQMWFWEIIADNLMVPELVKSEKEIYRIKRLIDVTQGWRRPNSQENFEIKLQRAKEVPIYELARNHLELKPSGKNWVALCPLHKERTGSFYLYTESNRYHCFGCNENGDQINLTMHLCGINFRDAVEMLQ
jgi:CHC2 zinc finger